MNRSLQPGGKGLAERKGKILFIPSKVVRLGMFLSSLPAMYYYLLMKKKSLLTTNVFLKNRKTRDKLLKITVVSSSAVEGGGKSAEKAFSSLDKIKAFSAAEGSAVKRT